jgi:hypothetical protein
MPRPDSKEPAGESREFRAVGARARICASWLESVGAFGSHSGLSTGLDQFFDSVASQRSSSVAKFPTCEAGPYPLLTATIQRPSLIVFERNLGFSLIQEYTAESFGPTVRRTRPAQLGDRSLADRAGRVIGGMRDPKTNRLSRQGRFSRETVAKPFSCFAKNS